MKKESNDERNPIVIYRTSTNNQNIGMQESGKASFPGEKIITEESPEFDRDDEEIKL